MNQTDPRRVCSSLGTRRSLVYTGQLPVASIKRIIILGSSKCECVIQCESEARISVLSKSSRTHGNKVRQHKVKQGLDHKEGATVLKQGVGWSQMRLERRQLTVSSLNPHKQNGSSLEHIQEEAEAIMRQTSSHLSRLTSQRMKGGGGGGGRKAAGSELSSQHSNKQEAKSRSNQL